MGINRKSFRYLAKDVFKMIKINIVGDISLNNKYQEFGKKHVDPFTDVESLFNDANLNLGNLECLCSNSTQENKLKVPRLKTDVSTLNLLIPLRMHMLSIAHNHIFDNCEEGIACTLAKLQSLNIQSIGYGVHIDDDPYVVETHVDNLPVAIITALHKDTNPHLPENVQLNVPWYDVDRISSDIQRKKTEGFFVIVYLHWGGRTEKGFMPDWYEIQDAHHFVDEGADIVVGGHSHTIQPYEKYKGKYIFYSLGNFCFDDVETDGMIYPIGRYRKRKGLIISLNIHGTDGKYDVLIQQIRNINGVIKKHDGNFKLQFRNFKYKILAHNKLFWKLDFLLFRKFSPLCFYLFENPDSVKIKLSKFKLKKIFNHFKS